jgi:monofunctional biosynthetic peptidoglycan transglycosylase
MPTKRTRSAKQTSGAKKKWLLRSLKWLTILLAGLLLADLYWLSTIWPDWDELASGSIPESSLIRQYRERANIDSHLPAVRWNPVELKNIPYTLRRAVIIAEDGRFYQHNGFDFKAIRNAWDYNLRHMEVRYGASTISQQTVKNLFLSNERNLLRKWHELILTWQMEQHLSKDRILELYLNIAQFGPGIFGVQAASYYYWGRPVWTINKRQAAELAACLPSPTMNNPGRYTPAFAARVNSIHHRMTEAVKRQLQ